MKRVLYYGLSNNKGGIEVVALNIFNNINRKNIMFDFLICGENIAFEKEIQELGGTIYKITKRRENPFKHYVEYVDFFRRNKNKYDAVHFSYCTLYNIFPMILSKLFRIRKIILHARSNSYNTNKKRLKLAHIKNRYIANAISTDFLACSELAAKFMFTSNRLISKDYLIFRNPINLDKFSYNPEIRNNKRRELNIEKTFVLGHVGAFLPVKNHKTIIAVFNEVIKKNKDSKLILIGGGIEEIRIKKQAEELGINEHIIYTGVVDNTYEYMQAMDAFIFPSLYEGFGNVLIEAQATGLPCFVSDTITKETGVTELIEYLSLNDSPEIWASKILNGYNENQRVDRSKEISNLGFSINKCVEAYENLYNS